MPRRDLRATSRVAVAALLLTIILPASAPASAQARERASRLFVPHELLVRFRHGVGARAARAVRAGEGSALERRLGLPGLQLVRLAPGVSVRSAARSFERRPEVLYAEPNLYRRQHGIPDDPRFPDQWGMQNTGQPVQGNSGSPDADVDAPQAWDLTTGDSGVTVAVVDGGIAYDHPDLMDNIWHNPGETGGGKETNGTDDDANGFADDFRGWDFTYDFSDPAADTTGDNDPYDDDGHGTHVAGTIGARGDNATGIAGLNWQAQLMPLRTFTASGGGTLEGILAAYAYARDMGADVLNASFGDLVRSRAEADMIASAPNVLFVTSAGNDSLDNDRYPLYPCNYRLRNIVCVAASNQRDTLARFSNFGRRSVDLAAPGVNAFSTVLPDSPQEVFFDDFESPLGNAYVTGGTNDTWGRYTDQITFFGETFRNSGLADSPGALYRNNTNSFARTQSFDLRGMTDCQLEFFVQRLDLEDGYDFLVVEGSTDGTHWTEILRDTGQALEFAEHASLAAFDGAPTFLLRFRLISDASGRADGVKLDELFIGCRTSYAFFSGTSMAAPHVAGVAALLRAQYPGAPLSRLRARLLGFVDRKPGLAGQVVTGGRLNAFRALADTDTTPPDTIITAGPSGGTTNLDPKFRFHATEPYSSFRCRLDSAPLGPCDAPGSDKPGPLAPGGHRFVVVATDPFGNSDPTPARRVFTARRP